LLGFPPYRGASLHNCFSHFCIRWPKEGIKVPVRAAWIILLLLLINRSEALRGVPEQPGPAKTKTDTAQKERARDLLAQARAAVGGEKALSGIKSIAASARSRSFVKYVLVKSPTQVEEREKVLKGKMKIEFLLPDKSRRVVSSSTIWGWKDTYAEITSGDRAWRDPPLIAESSRRERQVIDVSDFKRSLAYQAQLARHNLGIYSLTWLLQAPPNLAFEYRYIGLLTIDGTPVETIEVTGSDNSTSYFLLDEKTHLPFGFIMNFMATLTDPVLIEPSPFDIRNLARLVERARQEIASRSRPPWRFRVLTRFSDHHRIGGLLLPYRMTTSIDERLYEEWRFSSFSVNGYLDPKNYEPPPVRK
jgi:hypothetical protein